jgi:hypothetical protein
VSFASLTFAKKRSPLGGFGSFGVFKKLTTRLKLAKPTAETKPKSPNSHHLIVMALLRGMVGITRRSAGIGKFLEASPIPAKG